MALFRCGGGSDLPILNNTNDSLQYAQSFGQVACGSVTNNGVTTSYTHTGGGMPSTLPFGTVANKVLTYTVAGKYYEMIILNGVKNAQIVDRSVDDSITILKEDATGDSSVGCIIKLS